MLGPMEEKFLVWKLENTNKVDLKALFDYYFSLVLIIDHKFWPSKFPITWSEVMQRHIQDNCFPYRVVMLH